MRRKLFITSNCSGKQVVQRHCLLKRLLTVDYMLHALQSATSCLCGCCRSPCRQIMSVRSTSFEAAAVKWLQMHTEKINKCFIGTAQDCLKHRYVVLMVKYDKNKNIFESNVRYIELPLYMETISHFYYHFLTLR